MDRTWRLVRRRFAVPIGVTLAAGTAGVVLVALVCAAATPPAAAVARLVALAVYVAAVGAVGRDLVAALATAAIAWTVLDGFLVNRLGVLTWHGSADAARLGVLLAAAAAGWLAALGHRTARHRRDVLRLRTWLSGDEFASSIRRYKEANPHG